MDVVAESTLSGCFSSTCNLKQSPCAQQVLALQMMQKATHLHLGTEQLWVFLSGTYLCCLLHSCRKRQSEGTVSFRGKGKHSIRGKEFSAEYSGTGMGRELSMMTKSPVLHYWTALYGEKVQRDKLPRSSSVFSPSFSLQCPLGIVTSTSHQNTSVSSVFAACHCPLLKPVFPWEGFEIEDFFPLLLALLLGQY